MHTQCEKIVSSVKFGFTTLAFHLQQGDLETIKTVNHISLKRDIILVTVLCMNSQVFMRFHTDMGKAV